MENLFVAIRPSLEQMRMSKSKMVCMRKRGGENPAGYEINRVRLSGILQQPYPGQTLVSLRFSPCKRMVFYQG